MKLLNKNLSYWLRIIHRDLGYLMVGVCLVYATSGFLLNHMNGKDPAFNTVEATVVFDKNLNVSEIKEAWNSRTELPHIKKAMKIDDNHIRLMLDGGLGVYNAKIGSADYETHEKRPVIYWFNRLHYNRINGWNIMGDFFAFSLAFFAISGLFLVKGKNGLRGRGKWLLAIGILIPILYIFLS